MSIFQEKLIKIIQLIPFNFQKFFPSFLKKMDEKQINIVYRNHIDSIKSTAEKIAIEKRKRNQAYYALDYILSLTTYFDFFSADAFQIAKDSKNFAQVSEKKLVASDLLLFSFFSTNSKILDILKNFGMTKETVQEFLINSDNSKKESFLFLKNFLKNLQSYSPFAFKSLIPDLKIQYSLEVNKIFEKAAENAVERFKTPVIGTEILFITLMEEKNTQASKIIQKFLTNESDWFLLRYILIKKIYNQELVIRTKVDSNQHYFAYLLKSRLTDVQFQNLLDNGYLSDAIFSFRNQLISESLKINIYELLEKEVYKSIRINKRKKNRLEKIDRFATIEKKTNLEF